MKKMSLFFAYFLFVVRFAGAVDLPGHSIIDYPAPAQSVSTGFSSLGITVAGGYGQGSAGNQFEFPGGIVVDLANNVYVADLENSRVQKWAPGALTGVTVAGGNGYGSAANQLRIPADVAVDQAGNVYVLDGSNQRVQKWAPGASVGVTVAGGNGQGEDANQFNYPSGIFLDPSGNIYISDSYNNRVQRWAPGASAGITVAGGHGYGNAANQLANPNGIFVDGAGNIYMADPGNNRIQKWAPGALAGITVAGGNGDGQAANQIFPNDVFVDMTGNIYITDIRVSRVMKWAPGASEGIKVAGGNYPGTGADQFNFPAGIFFDQTGNMYVCDSRNQRVQKFLVDQTTTCLPNLFFTAPSCSATTTIKWTELHDTFPATIDIPEELDLSRGKLYYIGVLNGHGYYRSSNAYAWPVAKDISFYIGDTGANGHLLSIASAAENNYIFNLLKGSGYSPWIGFYNTGKQGQFGWVSGEPTAYTNWAPNEPNNYPGNPRFIKEPYVRLTDANGTWNDQRSDNFPFITEFDEPVIRYKQTSGPANGSAQSPGVYQVCYEITNNITGEITNCCFSVTVHCPSSLTAGDRSPAITDNNIMSATNGGLSITTSPNPSNNYFRLKVAGSRVENSLDIIVTDVQGRVVETRKGIKPGEMLQIGEHYRPGIYVAQVTQGSEKVMIRIVKQ